MLQGARLRHANLQGADLQVVDLRKADLQGANLQDAKLWGANLAGADLAGAQLEGVDFGQANLAGANLETANLAGADLHDAKGLIQDQLKMTCSDQETKLPAGFTPTVCLDIPPCFYGGMWSCDSSPLPPIPCPVRSLR